MELRPTSSTGGSKLRLMCSYGGHIVPRPGSKSLCYAGGDTRIVAVDRRTITALDLLVSHLSTTLCVNFSFTLKYQLPHLDLDSLISLTSDEDFQILIDEHDRLCSAPPSGTPSRIRVFLFPIYSVPGPGRPVIRHPKTESWFFDALKSAKIMHKGIGEAQGHGYVYGSGVEAHGFVTSGPESMVLETSSSFGSTSSSASLTNLPSLKAQNNEDNELVLQDGKVKLTPTNTVPNPSDNSVSMETRAYSTETIKLESSNNTYTEVGYNTSFPHSNQVQRQNLQSVPLQHMAYHPNQPYPIYLVPCAQIPPNSLPPTASNHASLLNLNSSIMISQNFRPASSGASHGSKEQEIDVPPMYVQSQTVAMTSTESPEYGNRHEGGNFDHVLIYKSQPPPPSLPSQYRTMSKDTKVLVPEGLAQDQDFT